MRKNATVEALINALPISERPPPSTSKRCPRCRIRKEKVEFSVDKSKKGGRKAHCRECDAELHRIRYAARRIRAESGDSA
jgi:transposase